MAANIKLINRLKREEVEKTQMKKFQVLFNRIVASNLFYRNKFKKAGIKSSKGIRDWKDFYKLPFTTKKELWEDQKKNGLFGTNITRSLEKDSERIFSSTGTIKKHSIFWFETHDDAKRRANFFCGHYKMTGIKRGDRFLLIGPPFDSYPRFASVYEALNMMGVTVVVVGSTMPMEAIKNLKTFPFKVLNCSPSYAFHLAECLIENGHNPIKLGIKKIIAIGEPGGSNYLIKKRVEEIWGAKLYDLLAMGETGSTYGIECQFLSGSHLSEDWYIFEIINPKTLRPADEGELVITNLWREGFPLIRYRTGDFTKINRNQCRCGSAFYRLRDGIPGRLEFMTRIDGRQFFPSDFEGVIFPFFPEVREFRVEVDKHRNKDRVTVILETKTDDKRRLVTIINEKIETKLELNADFIVFHRCRFPRLLNKQLRLIDRRKTAKKNLYVRTRESLSRIKNKILLHY